MRERFNVPAHLLDFGGFFDVWQVCLDEHALTELEKDVKLAHW